MAREWFQFDCDTPRKPEVLEVADRLDLEIALVVGRFACLWAWAQVHCVDGEARLSMRSLCHTVGGDPAFWMAARDAGWLEIDGDRVVIPKWSERFSQAAKERRLHAVRSADSESRRRSAGGPGAEAPEAPAPQRRRIEEIRNPPPPPREAAPGEAWDRLRTAWNAGPGKPWKPAAPPDGLAERLAEPGWLDEALEAIPRLQGARFFRTPVTLLQFVRPGFVRRLAGGQYDEAKAPPPGIPGAGRTAADAAAEWERGAAEGRKRAAEYVAAKAARGAKSIVKPAPTDDGFDHAEAQRRALAQLQEATQ